MKLVSVSKSMSNLSIKTDLFIFYVTDSLHLCLCKLSVGGFTYGSLAGLEPKFHTSHLFFCSFCGVTEVFSLRGINVARWK